jgi:hypothetical protein
MRVGVSRLATAVRVEKGISRGTFKEDLVLGTTGSGRLAVGSRDLQEAARRPAPIQKIKALVMAIRKVGSVIVLESSEDLGYLCGINYKSSEKRT